MVTSIGSTLMLGFILGLQHALQPDHVVAVSTLVSREGKPLQAALAGMFWGVGHTITLLLVGTVVLGFKLTVPVQVALSLEFLVGALLMALGGQILWDYWRKRFHTHRHGPGKAHLHWHPHDGDHDHHREIHHRKSLLVGMIHGLAGGGALVLLVLGIPHTLLEGLAYILVFGGGSILGMMVISTLLGLPFVVSATRFEKLSHALRLLSGTVSFVLGAVVMVQIGLLSGLFSVT